MADERDPPSSLSKLLQYLDDASSTDPAKKLGLFEPVTRIELLRFTLTSVACQKALIEALRHVRTGDDRAEASIAEASNMFMEAVRAAARASGVEGLEAVIDEQVGTKENG